MGVERRELYRKEIGIIGFKLILLLNFYLGWLEIWNFKV